MLSHDVVLARDLAFGDNHAAVHYGETITDCQTEIEVLLDDEDADFSFLFDVQQCKLETVKLNENRYRYLEKAASE